MITHTCIYFSPDILIVTAKAGLTGRWNAKDMDTCFYVFCIVVFKELDSGQIHIKCIGGIYLKIGYIISIRVSEAR